MPTNTDKRIIDAVFFQRPGKAAKNQFPPIPPNQCGSYNKKVCGLNLNDPVENEKNYWLKQALTQWFFLNQIFGKCQYNTSL